MRIELEWVDDADGELAELESFLRQDPRLDDVSLGRGRPVVEPGKLGATEILELIATNVGLGVLANALYDFLKSRARSRSGGEPARLRLTRTDRPDGTRRVEIDVSGPAGTVEKAVRDALGDD